MVIKIGNYLDPDLTIQTLNGHTTHNNERRVSQDVYGNHNTPDDSLNRQDINSPSGYDSAY